MYTHKAVGQLHEMYGNIARDYAHDPDVGRLYEDCFNLLFNELGDRARGSYNDVQLFEFMSDWNDAGLDALGVWRDSEHIDEWFDAIMTFAQKHEFVLRNLGFLPHDFEDTMSGDEIADAVGNAIKMAINDLIMPFAA